MLYDRIAKKKSKNSPFLFLFQRSSRFTEEDAISHLQGVVEPDGHATRKVCFETEAVRAYYFFVHN